MFAAPLFGRYENLFGNYYGWITMITPPTSPGRRVRVHLRFMCSYAHMPICSCARMHICSYAYMLIAHILILPFSHSHILTFSQSLTFISCIL